MPEGGGIVEVPEQPTLSESTPAAWSLDRSRSMSAAM